MYTIAKSDSASDMFVHNRIENYDTHNRHLIYALISRLLDSDNQIVKCLIEWFILDEYICGAHGGNRSSLHVIQWPSLWYSKHVYSLSRCKYMWNDVLHSLQCCICIFLPIWAVTWNKVLLLLFLLLSGKPCIVMIKTSMNNIVVVVFSPHR